MYRRTLRREGARCLRLAAAALVLASLPLPARAPAPPAGACDPLCQCRGDHLSCNNVPFHRFPQTPGGVRHVSVAGAALGALEAAALDARALRTLVLVSSRLHSLDPHALQSSAPTLASLDLGFNEFTEPPIEPLRELRVLNWLNLQNNLIADLDPEMDWGFPAETLSSLSLANNQLRSVAGGALARLRRLAHLDLEGNQLLALATGALPPALATLRLADNLLRAPPCAALAALPRVRALLLRGNALRAAGNATPACPALDALDLSLNELTDAFTLAGRPAPRHLALDLNRLTAVPAWAAAGGRLERLSVAHNRIASLSEATLRALRPTLVRLDLEHNELAEAPAGLRGLARLRRLSLAYNALREFSHPPPHLRHLSLAGNRLAEVPAGLRTLTPATLAHLDLGYNLITAVRADSFGAWAAALGSLDLRANRIARLGADAFPPTLPLRELVLSFNELTEVAAGALDDLPALHTLELSTALAGGAFPPAGVAIAWLRLDNNDIRRVVPEHLAGFPSLEYLNLDFNKITEFPSEVLGVNGSSVLRELRLSYNRLTEIKSGFARGLPELRSADLSYNRVEAVDASAFASLPRLRHVSLAGNRLAHLAPRAFAHLPRLEALDLRDNRLAELSSASLERVSKEDGDLTLNASHNRIATLVAGWAGAGGGAFVHVLDLSHNLLQSVPAAFFAALGARVRRLVLAHNRLATLDGAALGALPALRVLSLEHNALPGARRRALAETPALHALDLSHNELAQLSAEQFRGLRRLRHLRLAHNLLRSLPRDCLADTLVEHLDLSDNRLAAYPSAALAAVGFTLRRLELARNRLERLDAAMFRATPFLRELGLAANALTALPDDAFGPLARLAALDLSGNVLRADLRELLRAAPRLRRLALAGAGLRAAPAPPLPHLVEFDLSDNRLAALRDADVRHLPRLRTLRLAGNALTGLRPAPWAAVPRLALLDVSANPIVRIASGSFDGLPRLRALRLDRLPRLEVLDPRAFRALPALRELALDEPPPPATLALVTAAAPALEALTLHVHSASLDSQLRGVRAARLRAVEVHGAALRRVSVDAFSSLGAARALTLRLRGTRAAALPAGLAGPLARVPHLALDLSNNELAALEPATFYPNLTEWERVGTKLLPGGLVVAGNPLRCGCGTAWVGAWLRRWAAEAGGWGARAAARASSCLAGAGRVPLVAQEAREAACPASAPSSRAPPAAAPLALPPFCWLVALHALS